MEVIRLTIRVIGILLLAALVSAAWLFRGDIMQAVGRGATSTAASGIGVPSAAGLGKARDKVDSLNGWHADSIVITAGELASLLVDGLPREVVSQFDSVSVALGDRRVKLSGRLDTSNIPRDVLGPFAGALERYEPVALGGTVEAGKSGTADWTVDQITLRGFELPQPVTKEIVSRALYGSKEGTIQFALPEGVGGIRINSENAVLYPVKKR